MKYDRDSRVISHGCSRGLGLELSQPFDKTRVWGGSQRRLSNGINYVNDLESYTPSVPKGFAAYSSYVINPFEWVYHHIPGWRVALPRSLSSDEVGMVLNKIRTYGPSYVGYVRLNDTMVPESLSPGNRMALATN